MTFKNIICAATAGVVSVAAASAGEPCRQELSDGWQFRQERGNDWHPAKVPGTVHTDLMDNGLIDDPYIGLNERSVQWVDKEDWRYRTVFDVSEDIFSAANIEIVFEGLDTYADVFLNGKLLFSADNMFRLWSGDVKNVLKKKGNELEVLFHSPVKTDLPKYESLPFAYEATNDQSVNGGLFEKKVSVFARKAGYHYGWDWGPRIVTSGIWRPVYLRAWNGARISDAYYRQMEVTSKKADVTAEIEITADKDYRGAVLEIFADGKAVAETECDLEAGTNVVKAGFTVRNPKLWWTRELGEPYMYRMEARLTDNGSTLSSKSSDIGLRSLRLIRDKVDDGVTFYFELNGEPVFMKGANYIPCDIFLPRVTEEIYRNTIADAVDVNMNMLRVWGGGVYEDDFFYDLCDRNGILVWQDFMFACSVYPFEGHFAENVAAEAEYNIKRLRNHPCIALWCGNNECNDAWYGWGWRDRYEKQGHPEYDRIIEEQLHRQYYEVLPQAVEKFSPGTLYHPSSPWSRTEGTAEPHSGDMHNWQVWHGKAPISSYGTTRSRFFSEYGFQSFPGIESIKSYVPDQKDWRIDSDVMMAHQRGGEFANMRIAQYMEDEYWKPEDFDDFIYMSHVLQGDAIKAAIEAHRRDKPYCWGSLFWQHNDCWPVASWASRDWYGCWKAQHYFSKAAFDDILVSPVVYGGNLKVIIVSDRRRRTDGFLKVRLMDVDGTVAAEYEKKVTLAPNSSTLCLETDISGYSSPEKMMVHVEFAAKENTYSNIAMFSLLKETELPDPELDVMVEKTGNGYNVTVSAKKFARAVWLTIDGTGHHFSDNYFDLLPGASRTVSVATDLDKEEFIKQLRVKHLAQTKR